MKEKGFTLIELLAVIVILAIIALIAVPIVLNIINSSKESSDERSIELYGEAVEQAIARKELTKKVQPGIYESSEDGKELSGETPLTVEYDRGTVYCKDIYVYVNGNVYLENCKVNEKEVDYTYGEKISFEEDTWEKIVNNIKAGNASLYKLGATKEITLTDLGTYKVRVVNTSTPEECNTEGFSETACGFVIEFEDIITTHKMNPTNTNGGGWKASEMRSYVNDTIYNALPSELQTTIIPTTVVSAYKNVSEGDKLYLLSLKEVYDNSEVEKEIETRQLDYYKEKGISASNHTGIIKKLNGSSTSWWLRSHAYIWNQGFFYSNDDGWKRVTADTDYGVSPAFRIG